MKIFIIVISFLSCLSNVYACKCVGKVTLNLPESKLSVNTIQTAGLGYLVEKNNTISFKFLVCFNRPNCNDLTLSNFDVQWYLRELANSPKLTLVESYFNSFEEGLGKDKIKNLQVGKEKEFVKNNPIADDVCECPIPEYKSLVFNSAKNKAIRENLIRKIDINKKLMGCGCEEISINKNVKTNENFALDGFLFEKGDKLFFKKLEGEDLVYYTQNYPTYVDKIKDANIERRLKDELNFLKKNMTPFGKKLEKIESNSIEIKEKDKCNPIAKDILNQRIVIRANQPFDVKNNSLINLNLCKMTIEKKDF